MITSAKSKYGYELESLVLAIQPIASLRRLLKFYNVVIVLLSSIHFDRWKSIHWDEVSGSQHEWDQE